MKQIICTCDRCGKRIILDDEARKIAPSLKRVIIIRCLDGEKEMDLCLECQKELYKWATGREWKI